MPVDWSAVVTGPCLAVFGEPVTYLSAVGGQFQITGVFDEAYLELTPMGRGPGLASEAFAFGSPGAISTEMPVLGVQMSQFPIPPAQGDQLTVRGNTYAVKEVRPDGHGAAKLLLNMVYDATD